MTEAGDSIKTAERGARVTAPTDRHDRPRSSRGGSGRRASPERAARKGSRSLGAGSLIVKLILVGLVDALLIVAIVQCIDAEWWLAVGLLRRRPHRRERRVLHRPGAAAEVPAAGPAVPDRVPAVHDGVHRLRLVHELRHRSPRTTRRGDQAIERQSVVPVRGAAASQSCRSSRTATSPCWSPIPSTGEVSIGTNDGLTPVPEGDVLRDGDRVTGVTGYESLNLRDAGRRHRRLPAPVGGAAAAARRGRGTTCARSRSPRRRQARTGLRVRRGPGRHGRHGDRRRCIPPTARSATSVSSRRSEVSNPGWQVGVGFENYTRLFTDDTLRSRFLPITVWTFFFAIASTFLNFSLGLMLALVLRERRMRGKGIYRLLAHRAVRAAGRS